MILSDFYRSKRVLITGHTGFKGTWLCAMLLSMGAEVTGYALDVSRRASKEGEETRAHFLFNSAEALGICEAITGAMYIIAFGIPMLVAHDTAAYKSEAKAMRHAAAA